MRGEMRRKMRELWDKIKQPNVCDILVSEGEKAEKVFEEINA